MHRVSFVFYGPPEVDLYTLLPHIVQQLEDIVSDRKPITHYSIPPCKELCIYPLSLEFPLGR